MKQILRIVLLVVFLLPGCSLFAQLQLSGKLVDTLTQEPLPYVNIGIKIKNKGTTSLTDGSFSMPIPQELVEDTLTFSLVGYYSLDLPIKQLLAKKEIIIRLREKTTQLAPVNITAEKLVEKKYGIKKRNLLLHFTDGMFESNDIFEIGQLIKLGNKLAQITSLNLHLNASRTDSATFRINFYRLSEGRPAERLIEKSILQRHPIQEGWLKFDLQSYAIHLEGNFVVSLEFIPEPKKGIAPLYYEVKLGGTSRSFYRRNSLGQWNTPPHHYCMYVTALVDKKAKVEEQDQETRPTMNIPSAEVQDTFSLFIHVPKDYARKRNKTYPVIYQLDANAYFDHTGYALGELKKKQPLAKEAILVGIGYKNAYLMDSLRVRDYTFPPAPAKDSLAISGGGEKFYQFLKKELIPYIDQHYRTDTTQRTLMGHSFGGYFTLYALLRNMSQQSVFNSYVAASPSLAYDDYYLIKEFEKLATAKEPEGGLEVYVTIGEMELQENGKDNFNRFVQLLSTNNGIKLKSKKYEGLDHMGTAVPSFEEGLKLQLVK